MRESSSTSRAAVRPRLGSGESAVFAHRARAEKLATELQSDALRKAARGVARECRRDLVFRDAFEHLAVAAEAVGWWALAVRLGTGEADFYLGRAAYHGARCESSWWQAEERADAGTAD